MTTCKRRASAYDHVCGTDRRLLVLCDHASNRIPGVYGSLGLPASALRDHIAFDIGAHGVAVQLARILRAPLYAHRYSRLLTDANRAFGDAAFAPAVSDGQRIPGNAAITAAELEHRQALYHEPYHRAITRHLRRFPAFVISVHSFTPRMNGIDRPWHAGVLWRDDAALAHRLIDALAQDGSIIGDNQPYDGHIAMGATLERHAIAAQRPYTMFEIRQDLIAHPRGQRHWARKLARALSAVGIPTALGLGDKPAGNDPSVSMLRTNEDDKCSPR